MFDISSFLSLVTVFPTGGLSQEQDVSSKVCQLLTSHAEAGFFDRWWLKRHLVCRSCDMHLLWMTDVLPCLDTCPQPADSSGLIRVCDKPMGAKETRHATLLCGGGRAGSNNAGVVLGAHASGGKAPCGAELGTVHARGTPAPCYTLDISKTALV